MEKKKYKVVAEFVLPVLQEVGTIVELTAEQANSGEFGPKIEPVTDEDNSSNTGGSSNEDNTTNNDAPVLKKYKVLAEDGVDFKEEHYDLDAEFEADPESDEFKALAEGEVEEVA